MVDAGVGEGACEAGRARGRSEERVDAGIVEVLGVVHVAAREPVEVVAGVAGIAGLPVDGQIPGCALFQHADPELAAREALHLDVDADRGEVFGDDLGRARAAALQQQ